MSSFLIFLFFFIIYLSTNGGHLDFYDGTSAFLMTENFVLHGSPYFIGVNLPSIENLGFPIDRHIDVQGKIRAWGQFGKNADYYLNQNITKEVFAENYLKNVDRNSFPNGNYLVLPTLAVPLYILGNSVNFPPIYFVPLLLNSVILASSALVIFKIGDVLFKSVKIGFVLALVFGLTSFIWPYVGTMLARPVAILFLLITIYLILLYQKNRKGNLIPFFAGISLGLSLLSHSIFLMIIPGIAIYGLIEFRKEKKIAIVFVGSLFFMIFLQGYFNVVRFDAIDEFGMVTAVASATNRLENISTIGIFGYLFTPGRSIFLYFPMIALYPISLFYLFKRNKNLAILFIYISLVVFLFTAIHPKWDQTEWGSHRYHLPLIPIVAITLGSLISEFPKKLAIKIGIITLACLGFIVNFLASLVGYENALRYGRSLAASNIYGGGGFTWNPYYSPIVQPFNIIWTDWLSTIEFGPKIGHSNCSFDLYFYCEYGIMPIILFGIIIFVIGFFILQNLKLKATIT